MRSFFTNCAIVLSILLFTSNTYAEVCAKRTAVQWGGPETRTRCIGYAWGKWPWGGEWKTCNEWATDLKQHSTDVVVHCPTKNMPTAVTQVIDACIGTAISTAIGSITFQPATAFELLNGKLTALDASFKLCISNANAVGSILGLGYRIEVQNNNFW